MSGRQTTNGTTAFIDLDVSKSSGDLRRMAGRTVRGALNVTSGNREMNRQTVTFGTTAVPCGVPGDAEKDGVDLNTTESLEGVRSTQCHNRCSHQDVLEET